MAKPRRTDVFPPERSLQARMLLVLLLGLAFDAALIAAIVLYATGSTNKNGRWVVPVLLVFFAACAAQAQAVLAHELSHLANRDAVVMTLIAGPPTMVIWACQFLWERLSFRGWCFAVPLLPWLAVSPVPLAICRLFSRQRELAADRGAAMLTGSPSAVASALMRLSGEVPRIPLADLRSTGTSDLFHFLPAREYGGSDVRRIWATHPPVKLRLARLAQLEVAVQRRSPTSAAR